MKPKRAFFKPWLSLVLVVLGAPSPSGGQVIWHLGDNTSGATQNIVDAFNAWTGGGLNSMSANLIATGITDGGLYVMDSGVSASSPFGNTSTNNTTWNVGPITRSAFGGNFSYTVFNTPLTSTNATSWNNLTSADSLATTVHAYGTSGNITTRLTAAHNYTNINGSSPNKFRRENPLVQAGASLNPNSTINSNSVVGALFGFDGQDSGIIDGANRRDGFTLAFSDPITQMGVFLVDFESHSSNTTLRGLVSLWDENGNYLAHTTLDFGTPVDDNRAFVGISSNQAFQYISFWVGSDTTSTSPTAYAYGFGAFTFRYDQIPEPVYSLAALLGAGVLSLRRRKRLSLASPSRPPRFS